jgi:hypothetical protein
MNNPETQATGTRNRTNLSKAKQKQNKKDEQRGLKPGVNPGAHRG